MFGKGEDFARSAQQEKRSQAGLRNISGEIICYGYATTSGEMNVALLAFDLLIELAEKEKQAPFLPPSFK